MASFLFKILPMLLSMSISQFVYIKLDNKYNITNKISSILPIKQEWKASFLICCIIISILIIGIIGMYLINISDIVYYIITGLLTGIGVAISSKLQKQTNL